MHVQHDNHNYKEIIDLDSEMQFGLFGFIGSQVRTESVLGYASYHRTSLAPLIQILATCGELFSQSFAFKTQGLSLRGNKMTISLDYGLKFCFES